VVPELRPLEGEEGRMDAQDGAFYRELIDKMSDGVYFVDCARRITYWSVGAERLTGYRAEDMVGRECRDGLLIHVDDAGNPLCGGPCPLKETMKDGRCREAHVFVHHAAGHRRPVWVRGAPIRDSSGAIVGAVEVFSDDSVVRAARARVDELEKLAQTDTLTGLGNRRYLEKQLDFRLFEWERDGTAFGVLFVDIDLFKKVNDTYGHDAGDEVLSMVARTLSHGIRGEDVVARYGGEEFVVVLNADTQILAEAAERLRSLVAASRLVITHQPIEVTISLGGTVVAPGDDIEGILRRADLALYGAKKSGRNQYQFQG
jgi:diguanylate cyclase (GGDEF)-like protein/PAS domain S-box-containing protein